MADKTTPGDNEVKVNDVNNLSARLREVASDLNVAAVMLNENELREACFDARDKLTAALSALPAAGGAWNDWSGGPCLLPLGTRVAYRMRGHGEEEFEDLAVDLNWSHHGERDYEIVAYKVLTTPQPSAAAKVGCEGDDGLLRIHAESETCDVCAAEGECTNCGRPKRADRAIDACACASLTYTPPPDAAVGAQGDGYDAHEYMEERVAKDLKWFREERASRLAAPAVGKGVDEHPDDLAVDRFAAAMKAKLAKKRAEGRGGWDDPAQCPVELLSNLLHEHVAKGDPVDVGNLAMMLHQRDSGVLPPQGDLQSDLDLIWHSVSDTKETNAAHARLQAALTRQPVAGDGEQPWACGFCKRAYTLSAVCCDKQREYRAAPAATPTDGGEGKS